MSIALIADLHAANHRRFSGPIHSGINRRCRHVLDALEAAVARAKHRGAKSLVILGDLFDTTKPEPQIVREVQRILDQQFSMGVYVLMGNHDQVSTQEGDHSLGPLEPVANVIERPTWAMPWHNMQVLFVPFRPGPAVEWLPEVVVEMAPERHHSDVPAALLLHLGLADDTTPAFLRGVHDAVTASLVAGLCEEHGFDACFAGNWHHHKVLRKKPLVCQVGTLAPTGFDNLGLDHGQVVFWDGKAMSVEQVPGPRFVKVAAGEPVPAAEGCQVYVQVLAGPDEPGSALQELQTALGAGEVCAGEVVQDTTQVRAATRKAAMVARSSDTLDEALASYVEEMPLEDGVDRAEVLATCKGYLGA